MASTKKKKKGLKKPKNLSVKQKKNSKKAEGTRNFRKSSTKKPVIKTKKAKSFSKKPKRLSASKTSTLDKIRRDLKEVSENLDSNYKVAQRKNYIEARLKFDGDPTLMGGIIRDVQTNRKLVPKGKRVRFQITFIPDEDLKELNYFKRNRMSTHLVEPKELMGKFRKMVDTTKERDWNFKQMFLGIVIDEVSKK